MVELSLANRSALVAAVAASCWSCGSGHSSDTLLGGADTGYYSDDAAAPDDSSPIADSASPPADTAPACPPSTTMSFTPRTYTAAVAHQGVCTAADVSDFVSACGQNSTTSSCSAWEATNLPAGDAGRGTACGRCIVAPDDNGGLWFDPTGLAYPNYGACIQLSDPIDGPSCSAAYDNATACDDVACDACPSTEFEGCASASARGACSTYVSTENGACTTDFADGGVATTCSPGAASHSVDLDYTYIITLVCGSL